MDGLSGEVFVLQLVATHPHILWGFGGLGDAKAVLEKVVGIKIPAQRKPIILFLQGLHAVQSVRPVIAAVGVPGNDVPAVSVFFEKVGMDEQCFGPFRFEFAIAQGHHASPLDRLQQRLQMLGSTCRRGRFKLHNAIELGRIQVRRHAQAVVDFADGLTEL